MEKLSDLDIEKTNICLHLFNLQTLYFVAKRILVFSPPPQTAFG